MINEFLEEYNRLVAECGCDDDCANNRGDDGEHEDLDVQLICKHTAKKMVPSKIVEPTKKFDSRTKDNDAAKFKPLVANEPSVGLNGNFMSAEYKEAVETFFDMKDNETRHILLSINEDDQNRALTALTSKLYEMIVDKVEDIDFGDIPKTQGNFTKLPSYNKICQCVEIMQNIITQYRQKVDTILVVKKAIENLVSMKDIFERAFRYKAEMPIMVYNTIALSIVSAMSLLISTCIEFVKKPGTDSFEVSFDSVSYVKSRDHLLFENLEKFNSGVESGSIEKALDTLTRNKMKNFTGVEIGMWVTGVAGIAVILNIVPILRELIYFFYYSRTRVADYFEVQADLLQLNAQNIELNGKNGNDKAKVVERQLKIVDLFRKISNFIAIDSKTAEVKSVKDINNTNKKFKTSDVLDTMPDSVAANQSALF